MSALAVTWTLPGGTAFNLQTSDPNNGVITSHFYDDDLPDVRMTDFPLARQDGAKFVSAYYGQKDIKVDGLIKSATASGLEGQIDLFKKQLYIRAGGVLSKTSDLSTRSYAAYVKSIAIKRDSTDITRAPFSLDFTVESGFSVEPFYVAQTTFSGVTQANFNFNVISSGTAPYQPNINIKVNAASQLGDITLINQASGETINIPSVFQANELLQINTSLAQVTVNGSGITYSGVMPRFLAVSGINPIKLTSASGTQNLDININYAPVYL